jgi:arylsulfatase A-like enzyme
MTERELETSYREPVLGAEQWAFTAGVAELSAARLAALELTYDASIAELDHYFEQLIAALERRGLLDETLVVLTSDHGELLGEHHLLDHQYSVHEPLLRVPLVLRHPRLVSSGREPRPVMNLDLFVTLLGLAGVPQAAKNARGVDLLAPRAERARLSEYPFAPRKYVGLTSLAWPDFDPTPFFRSLRAFRSGTLKYVQASDGTHELYDLAEDPGEMRSLVNEKPEVAAALDQELEHYLSGLVSDSGGERPEAGAVEFSDETRKMLDALGY